MVNAAHLKCVSFCFAGSTPATGTLSEARIKNPSLASSKEELMSATTRTYTDPIERVAKSYNKIVRRSQKREENREWQKVAREFKGVL